VPIGDFDGRNGWSVGAIDEREADFRVWVVLRYRRYKLQPRRHTHDTLDVENGLSRPFEAPLMCRPNDVNCQNGGLCGVILGRCDGPLHIV